MRLYVALGRSVCIVFEFYFANKHSCSLVCAGIRFVQDRPLLASNDEPSTFADSHGPFALFVISKWGCTSDNLRLRIYSHNRLCLSKITPDDTKRSASLFTCISPRARWNACGGYQAILTMLRVSPHLPFAALSRSLQEAGAVSTKRPMLRIGCPRPLPQWHSCPHGTRRSDAAAVRPGAVAWRQAFPLQGCARTVVGPRTRKRASLRMQQHIHRTLGPLFARELVEIRTDMILICRAKSWNSSRAICLMFNRHLDLVCQTPLKCSRFRRTP